MQNYVDIDPTGEVSDYACGGATYDGHKGTDFRVRSAAAAKAGVDVLAAAPGVVKGTRDGMQDIFAKSVAPGSLAGRECGNGVVIDHGGGWETQYCHMLKGSVGVRSGDTVTRGQPLGQVGFSGFADFAHVHLEVRKDGVPIDPFLGAAAGTACIADPALAKGLWTSEAATRLGYPKGAIIRTAFTGALPSLDELEADDAGAPLLATSRQLIFFARFINLAKGDRVRFAVTGPDGFAVDSSTEPLDRNKATYVGFAGKKLTAAAWPLGHYEGTAQIVRGGAVAAEQRASFQIKE